MAATLKLGIADPNAGAGDEAFVPLPRTTPWPPKAEVEVPNVLANGLATGGGVDFGNVDIGGWEINGLAVGFGIIVKDFAGSDVKDVFDASPSSKFNVCLALAPPEGLDPNLGVLASVIFRVPIKSLLFGELSDDLLKLGSGFTFVNPFLCRKFRRAVSFSGENP